ncbi:hypothetical protein PHYSODRAFT_303501 [Phytophthora sojae]|uniref:RxLR effector protein n=1 Tax=Phytophthora sojae (strain P6497) TaxID=1094619 RepID=G4ZS40_PHYSP|nr:hypothetical protein PHYSODRAFT_303501 [Phytophthora sojae]EGZ14336.1 hypothetical protein PHYSODRAFT_303501 [Phytophthora sojae]|eukprot:XP_009531765.1 hypothetical protein PHYSODRAFT_303501 [Phytophthora sojae]
MRVFQLALLAAAALLATASASVPPTEVQCPRPQPGIARLPRKTTPNALYGPTSRPTFDFDEENEGRGFGLLSQATLVKQYYSERNEFADWFLKGKGHPYMYGELGMAKEGVGSKAYLKLMRYVDYFEQYKAIAIRFGSTFKLTGGSNETAQTS